MPHLNAGLATIYHLLYNTTLILLICHCKMESWVIQQLFRTNTPFVLSGLAGFRDIDCADCRLMLLAECGGVA